MGPPSAVPPLSLVITIRVFSSSPRSSSFATSLPTLWSISSTAAAYTSKGEDRDRLVKRYFTADAQGLNIPTDRIAEQPDVQASGGMNAGTDTTATCSVWTGLESPWTLTYQWTADKGWKCTGISGPLEGAYTTLGDKTPDEKGEGEE